MPELEQILDEHGDAVYSFLLQLTRSDADARDLFQELWQRLVGNPTLLSGVRDPRAFLLHLARNLFIDLTRRRGARGRALDRAEADAVDLFQSAADPDEAEFCAALEKGLEQLPEEQRIVVHLKLWEGLTFHTIATALDIPQNTAASRYRYGIDKLRFLLRPLYDEIRSP